MIQLINNFPHVTIYIIYNLLYFIYLTTIGCMFAFSAIQKTGNPSLIVFQKIPHPNYVYIY